MSTQHTPIIEHLRRITGRNLLSGIICLPLVIILLASALTWGGLKEVVLASAASGFLLGWIAGMVGLFASAVDKSKADEQA